MENNFRKARELCNMSQKEVAIDLCVSAPTVSEWESGKKSPTVDNLLKLRRLYGTTVDYLLGFTDEPSYKVPEALSLRGVTAPEEQEALLLQMSKSSGKRETQAITTALSNKALSLSDRATKIAIAYDMADEHSRNIVEIALEQYLSASDTQAG